MSTIYWKPHAGPPPGTVWLVGAGPGDPDLLTLRAAAALREADSVYHDALPGPAILRLINSRARIVNVGKRKFHAPWSQQAINAALIAAAGAGERVVRLKGGDPLLFARAGEELAALAEAGIPWRIVPGISAASAAAAAAGLPLTLRGVAGSVSYLTGHDAGGGLPDNIEALSHAGGTLVVFMALTRLDELAVRLLASGKSPATPLAIIGRAGLPGEQVLRTTLGDCTLAARRAAVPLPALLVIGAVAGLAYPNSAAAPPLEIENVGA